MVVIYAEKHSLAKTIAEALSAGKRHASPQNPTIAHWEFEFNGEKAILCHGAGHLAELIPAKEYDEKYTKWDLDTFPCIPDEMRIKPTSTALELLDYISPFFKSADWIINATDPDREGELIFDYVTELIFGNGSHKPWKRVILPDLTDETIKNAFSNLKNSSEMKPLQLAGRARSISDWLVGCNLTIAMTKKFGSKENLLSVGRVQTPTLSLVVNRENEIKNHKKTTFYKVVGNFTTKDGSFIAEYDGGKFDSESEAQKLKEKCTGKNGIVTEKTVSKEKQSAPLLFNATSLLAAANKKLGWELEKTTKIMQKLYESKLMSYPRSSSECLAEQQKDEAAQTIEMLMKLPELKEYALPHSEWTEFTKRHFDNSKVGSHTAIVPTKAVPVNLSALSEDEQALYLLIAKSLLAIVFPKAEIEKTNLKINVDENTFVCKGKRVVKSGWQILNDLSADEQSDDEEKMLPDVKEGDDLQSSFEITEGETQPPKRFTEATLILTMEAAGSKLEDKEAVELMKAQKKGLGTDATRAAIINALFDKKYIAKKGKSIYPTAKGTFLINTLAVSEMKSAELTGSWEKRLNDIAESGTEAQSLYDKFIRDIKEQVSKWYNEVKESNGVQYFSDNESRLVCPVCGKRLFKGKFGYTCTGYTEGCKFHINYEICGKKITESQAAMLCQSGKTAVIKGFKGKSGKVFDASLVLDRTDGKISFSFNNKGGK